jgi:hypothetical protein
MSKLTLIRQVFEVTGSNWIYRLFHDSDGTIVSRVPTSNQLWSHGVFRETYDFDEQRFCPAAICSSNVRFKTLEEAEEFVFSMLAEGK